MRFGLIHRVLTDALAALGILSLIASGELDRWIAAALLTALSIAMLIPESLQTHPRLRSFGVVASLGLLAVQTARIFLHHDVLTIAVEFAATLQVIRLATRRGAAHDQQIILLALLHLVAGTVLGGGIAYGLCFLGFLVIAPGALVLSHLRREVEGNYRQGARDRTGLPVDVPRILRSRRVISKRFLLSTCSLAIPIFVFTALLFVLFPRVGLSLLLLNHSRSERMVGFSDRVDLGKVGRLRTDPTIAVRVYIPGLAEEPPPRIPLYLRGTAFNEYDGRTWSRDKTQEPAVRTGNRVWVAPPTAPLSGELMTIDLEPIRPPVVFLPANVGAFDLLSADDHSLRHAPRVTSGKEGSFEYSSSEERGLRYRVLGTHGENRETLTVTQAQRYLGLPSNITSRMRQLAREWAQGDSPREIAENIERQLRTAYRYDLDSPSGARDNPLDHFLFESRRGHCEYYSTSMAVLLRVVGIPTRNVTGFVGGTFNRFGRFYAVRQGDAHSWVEVYLPSAGWTRFDPTPVAESAPRAEITGMLAMFRDIMEAASERWDRHVVGYDLDQQVRFLRSIREQWSGRETAADWIPRHRVVWASALVLAATLALAYYYWRKRRRSGPPPLPEAKVRPEALRVVELYRELEQALLSWGVPRRPETPPMAHALGLRAMHHPIANELVALTELYQEVRFGQRRFTEEDVQRFRTRVTALTRKAA